MAKIRNKRLRISVAEYITALLLLSILIAGAFFLSQYLDVKKNYNIKETSVDFIISAPSKDQVSEISALPHIDSVVPYVFRSIEVNKNNKTIETNLYIIENTSDLPSTVFSDKLAIKKAGSNPGNALYISQDFAQLSKLNLNDAVDLTIDGTSVKFQIAGIYKSDYRNVGGTLIAVLNDDIVSALGGTYRYNGAYVSSNDANKTRDYLDDYQPLGDLRSREEFSSDEAYQIYLDERKNDDGRSVFDRETHLNNVGKRNDARLIRNLLLAIVCSVAAIVLVCISTSKRLIGYINKHADNDRRNSFELDQERAMFKSFCVSDTFIMVGAYIIALLVSWTIFKIIILSLVSLIGVFVLVLLFIVEYGIAKTKLDAVFAKKINNEEEKQTDKQEDKQ